MCIAQYISYVNVYISAVTIYYSAISNGHINKILHNRIIVIITVFLEFYTFSVFPKEYIFY